MSKFRVLPLTSDCWTDFETLFGPRGACGGCWCMTPRMSRAEYERNKGEGNRLAMKAIVDRDAVPGLIGMLEEKPVAWCSLGPREQFGWLSRSRIFKPVDDRPVWSIVCLFIQKEHRGQGLSVRMIRAACTFAAEQGARCVEAYPVEPKKRPMPAVFAYTGISSAFSEAGFLEVTRRSETRPIMRREINARTSDLRR